MSEKGYRVTSPTNGVSYHGHHEPVLREGETVMSVDAINVNELVPGDFFFVRATDRYCALVIEGLKLITGHLRNSPLRLLNETGEWERRQNNLGTLTILKAETTEPVTVLCLGTQWVTRP